MQFNDTPIGIKLRVQYYEEEYDEEDQEDE